MGWWKADTGLPTSSPPRSIGTTTATPQTSPEPSSACPVDPQTRNIWLQQARQHSQASEPVQPPPSLQVSSSTFVAAPSQECSSDRIDQSTTGPQVSPLHTYNLHRPLSHERVISSIPRATPESQTQPPPSNTYANSETNAANHKSGNWIYPSESQFFHAVLRKHSPEALLPPGPVPPKSKPPRAPEADLASTIPTIIPIHNAVNERAWSLIKDWESSFNPAASSKPNSSNVPLCTGPKLLSFRGLGADAKTMTPRAHWNSLTGYTAPFDRHDWTIRRCDGSEVEYVIDFYQGKHDDRQDKKGQLNFHLDVRPKLNSVEGCRMRILRGVGLA